ncbi:MAG: GntR family transcriptional regulator [Magnetovibrio sp.]|nr:GntR family transcriptional regulator [Magnetovibrio sp.]
MVQFTAIKATRMSDTVIQQIEEMILDGALRPGERLPPERELAEQLGISRPTLREAIVILESKGLLESRRRGGTFVCDVSEPSISDPLIDLIKSRPDTVIDVLELRSALEETAAEHAARRATPEDREAIRAKHQELLDIYADPDGDNEAEARVDAELHMAIAEASHNVALVHVMRGLMQVLKEGIAFNLDKLRDEPANHARVRAQHAEICAAVLEGDPARARAAAAEHLRFVHETLSEHQRAEARAKRARQRS